ncbi:hypothetical protein [Epilithonimonas sp.]|uniref:hypothetical protein n=1 Tax=Epilithonimonas sp. TaxID=2894511 RepID=UPI0035B39EE5
MKILGKLYDAGKNKNANYEFCWTEIKKSFDKIIHQHHHQNISQIGPDKINIFEFGGYQNFC